MNDRYGSYIANGIIHDAERKNVDLVDTREYGLRRTQTVNGIRPYWKKPHHDSEWESSIIYLTSAEHKDALDRFRRTGKLDLYEIDMVSIKKLINDIKKEYNEDDLVIDIDERNSNAFIRTPEAAEKEKQAKEQASRKQTYELQLKKQAKLEKARQKAEAIYTELKSRLPDVKAWLIELARKYCPSLLANVEELYGKSLDNLISLKVTEPTVTTNEYEPLKYSLIITDSKDRGEFCTIYPYRINRFLNYRQSKETQTIGLRYIKEALRCLLTRHRWESYQAESVTPAYCTDSLLQEYYVTDDFEQFDFFDDNIPACAYTTVAIIYDLVDDEESADALLDKCADWDEDEVLAVSDIIADALTNANEHHAAMNYRHSRQLDTSEEYKISADDKDFIDKVLANPSTDKIRMLHYAINILVLDGYLK